MDEHKFATLKENENIRLEIFADLLKKYMNISVRQQQKDNDEECMFKKGFFLGRHEVSL